MTKNRLEAFSDGVIAIIITIMVLELKVPHGDTLEALKPLLPVFLCYILSFIYVAIYWNNHHHMLHAATKVNGAVLWGNTHLLFWLSLIPFATAWMGENHFSTLPVAVYGIVMIMCSIAYFILTRLLIKLHGKDSTLAIAIGKDRKGMISTCIYLIAISAAFINATLSLCCYAIVAVIWLIPDNRIEAGLKNQHHEERS
jgi:uncharacterized membrane protein